MHKSGTRKREQKLCQSNTITDIDIVYWGRKVDDFCFYTCQKSQSCCL